MYVGTDDGLIQISQDGGRTWIKKSSFKGVPDMTYVSCIYASKIDENVVYATFDGRKNNKLPHIVLYAQDDTQIMWGAKVGEWQRHLESTDEQKIAKLYSYYKEFGTLSGGVKFINLCDPLDDIPQPIDKY